MISGRQLHARCRATYTVKIQEHNRHQNLVWILISKALTDCVHELSHGPRIVIEGKLLHTRLSIGNGKVGGSIGQNRIPKSFGLSHGNLDVVDPIIVEVQMAFRINEKLVVAVLEVARDDAFKIEVDKLLGDGFGDE